MVKSKRRSTALKMALAGMCTALCIEGMLQHGLYVPAHAEDTEDENYVGSSEWEEFIDYWHSSMNVAVDDLTGGAFDADDVARLNTATYAYASMLYQQYAQQISSDPNTGAIDYSVDIPAGSVFTGWYYRGGEPRSVTLFQFGTNGDACIIHSDKIPVFVADDFTISISISKNQNIAYPSFTCVKDNSYLKYAYVMSQGQAGLSFTSIYCTGIFLSNNLSAPVNIWTLYPGDTANRIITFDEVSLYPYSYVFSTQTNRQLIGCLKDLNNQPISNSYQKFIRAQVGNNFPDFLLDLKQQLDDNFPEEVVDELWYDPTQGEPLPDVGSLDSLTFPPGLPSVQFNDVELPSEPLPEQAIQGVGFWFSAFTDMIDALGVKYIVVTFLVIALVLAILRI